MSSSPPPFTPPSSPHKSKFTFPSPQAAGLGSPFLIGVAGGTASGKTTVCQKIVEELGDFSQKRVVVISQDSFYKNLNDQEKRLANEGEYNFDHPGNYRAKMDMT